MAEIFIYDDIGPEWMGMVGAKSVLSSLDAVGKGKPVTVRINSPGGDVWEAQAIYNALRRQSDSGGKVTVEVDALAASAASFIAMAGDVVRMAENSVMMIHKASTLYYGNADGMRSAAETLDKYDGILAATYASRSKTDVADIMEMLAAETWLTASEAVDKGLADEIGQPLHIGACVKEGRFKNTPKQLLTGEPLKRELVRAKHVEQVQQQLRIARARLGV